MKSHDSGGYSWLEHGRGQPLVLLHGLLGRMHDWEVVLGTTGSVSRAIGLTIPIFEPRFATASISDLARYVRGFLDHLEVPKAVIGGNSMGGHIALEIALQEPGRVAGLVLTGSSGVSGPSVVRRVPRDLSTAFLRARMEEVFHDPSRVSDSFITSLREFATLPRLLRVLRFGRSARSPIPESSLRTIHSPTLLVWGAQDRITAPPVAHRFHELLPDSELTFIDACGHAAMLEQPIRFAAILQDWMSRHFGPVCLRSEGERSS